MLKFEYWSLIWRKEFLIIFSSVFTSLPKMFNYVFHKKKHKQKVLINLCKLVSGIKFDGCWFWYGGNLRQTYILYIVIFCLFQWPDWTTFDSGFFYNDPQSLVMDLFNFALIHVKKTCITKFTDAFLSLWSKNIQFKQC